MVNLLFHVSRVVSVLSLELRTSARRYRSLTSGLRYRSLTSGLGDLGRYGFNSYTDMKKSKHLTS